MCKPRLFPDIQPDHTHRKYGLDETLGLPRCDFAVWSQLETANNKKIPDRLTSELKLYKWKYVKASKIHWKTSKTQTLALILGLNTPNCWIYTPDVRCQYYTSLPVALPVDHNRGKFRISFLKSSGIWLHFLRIVKPPGFNTGQKKKNYIVARN